MNPLQPGLPKNSTAEVPVKRHRGEPGHNTGHTGHTGARGHTDHTDEPHNHPPKPNDTPARPRDEAKPRPTQRSGTRADKTCANRTRHPTGLGWFSYRVWVVFLSDTYPNVSCMYCVCECSLTVHRKSVKPGKVPPNLRTRWRILKDPVSGCILMYAFVQVSCRLRTVCEGGPDP